MGIGWHRVFGVSVWEILLDLVHVGGYLQGCTVHVLARDD